ncbi:hypothetical protein EDD22DRAFT_954197 [Suillus occidentalis]|nr:hypothetical protein EDD22DRAFT_954197 [Suillus occidentalis]
MALHDSAFTKEQHVTVLKDMKRTWAQFKEKKCYPKVQTEDNLQLLPENGLPSKLLAIIKHSDEQHLLEEEHESYIVDDLDTDGNDIDPTFKTLDFTADSADTSEDRPCNSSVVPLQAHGV